MVQSKLANEIDATLMKLTPKKERPKPKPKKKRSKSVEAMEAPMVSDNYRERISLKESRTPEMANKKVGDTVHFSGVGVIVSAAKERQWRESEVAGKPKSDIEYTVEVADIKVTKEGGEK